MLEEKLRQIRRLEAEVKELRAKTATDQPVTLHVKIMELQVSKMRKLGLDFQTADGVGFQQLTGGPLTKLEVVSEWIEALRKHELVKVLAEPSLVTVSGRPATFQSGGEFPIIVPQSLGTQTVEYRQLGTRLDCLAEELDSGRIRLALRADRVGDRHFAKRYDSTHFCSWTAHASGRYRRRIGCRTDNRLERDDAGAQIRQVMLPNSRKRLFSSRLPPTWGNLSGRRKKRAHPNVAKDRRKNNCVKCCNGWQSG